MDKNFVITVIKAVLCNEDVRQHLTELAAVTESSIDDMAVRIVYMILGCDN